MGFKRNDVIICNVSEHVVVVVVRWQQDENGKEARIETEGKYGRVHRGK